MHQIIAPEGLRQFAAGKHLHHWQAMRQGAHPGARLHGAIGGLQQQGGASDGDIGTHLIMADRDDAGTQGEAQIVEGPLGELLIHLPG